MTLLLAVEASLWSVTKVSSGSSVVVFPEAVVSVSASSESSSVSSSVAESSAPTVEVFPSATSGELDFDLLSVDDFLIHAKLSYAK